MWQRTGWVTQYQRTDDDNQLVEENDRFGCMWYGEGPDGYRMGYGPACVTLADALGVDEESLSALLRRWSRGRKVGGWSAE